MGVSVGTIVTRFNPHFEERSCENGICVGKIVKIGTMQWSRLNPDVDVKWWQSCEYHDYQTKHTYGYLLDELWEIGQIPIN